MVVAAMQGANQHIRSSLGFSNLSQINWLPLCHYFLWTNDYSQEDNYILYPNNKPWISKSLKNIPNKKDYLTTRVVFTNKDLLKKFI